MNLTAEQSAILASQGHLKINAVAGSGKTTTMVEYARAQPATARILYLAFNKTVRQEAIRKFQAAGLPNVVVETAHSLAYRYVVRGSRYELNHKGYRAHDLVEMLKLPRGTGKERHQEYVLANHIAKFVTYFCNSDQAQVQRLDYLATISDPKAREFVGKLYATIERSCRELLARMDRGEIAITHDFYLKKFQLSHTVLPADVILFDEGQDASGAMLDIFFRQPATKVIVGDTHQQIYGWRHAVNSLERTDYPSLQLSASFRFGPPIAELASQVLAWKTQLGAGPQLVVTGAAPDDLGEGSTRAVIGRTNLGLLLKAIEYVKEHRQQLRRVYFEGNINSYTYAGEGASLTDVLALYNGRSEAIKDPLIRKMANLDELADYAEQTEDGQLQMLITIVEDYGNDVIDLIKELKRLHVADGARDQAQLYFSTVHRCKGLEYDQVQLTPDFITQVTIDKLEEEFAAKPPEPGVRARVFEEINLLYVALTRAKTKVYVPAECLPGSFKPHAAVHSLQGTGGTVLLSRPPVVVPVHRTEWVEYALAQGTLDPRFASLQQKLDASSKSSNS
ncbi:UvrD-helicase domain-containing protein [Hymenobacter sp. BT175]|uniref:UvrD-helicase domain-containing protein n=1 Tax=Hymenobacter translucens TaxID=2886507 RepID=UPI001D0E9D48|nr:UvrD-helicase domain-containing protein [Hymenobacter translucens]MCC2548495.1 UvrD-helicase domain-containing protein [Hymenobacter translucens]